MEAKKSPIVEQILLNFPQPIYNGILSSTGFNNNNNSLNDWKIV